MKACRTCHLIVEGKDTTCPRCNGELSDRFSGIVIIIDPERSVVAKIMNINTPGKYAIKVR